jgi:hypothetical protein
LSDTTTVCMSSAQYTSFTVGATSLRSLAVKPASPII